MHVLLEHPALDHTRPNLKIDAFALVLSQIELMPCEDKSAPRGYTQRVLQWFIKPKQAFAHTDDTPTRIGAPYVVKLISPKHQKTMLGTWTPLPQEYCHVVVTIASADEDARNLTQSPLALHHSFVAHGTHTTYGAFELSTTAAMEVRIKLTQPLTLNSSHDTMHTITMHINPERAAQLLDTTAHVVDARTLLASFEHAFYISTHTQ